MALGNNKGFWMRERIEVVFYLVAIVIFFSIAALMCSKDGRDNSDIEETGAVPEAREEELEK